MGKFVQQRLPPSHPDYFLVEKIESILLSRIGGLDKLKQSLPILIRQAIDEVIDTPRTGRVFAKELEKTEKTYIGTKVEILVRNYFNLPKGILDLNVDGIDVDVKNTIGKTWMIPNEAVGKPCILVASNEVKQTCSFGLLICHVSNLTSKGNQDKKRSVSSEGFKNIHWIICNQAYPESFWHSIGPTVTHRIMKGRSGNERITELFRLVKERPIHRDCIEAVAQQKDYMKRLRKNGGARDKLAHEGIAILSGKYDQSLIKSLSLPATSQNEFVSVSTDVPEHRDILLRNKKIFI